MFSKILLPSDFSECSADAARAARRLAEHFGSRLTVLHVLDEPAAFDPMFRGEVPVELLRGRMEQYAREGMERFVDTHFQGIPDVATLTASGVPYREIIRTARETGAGLIVIGTHGRTGVEHVIFGSTAEKVVRMAPCPVLSVRQGDREFVHP
ncbi:MAG: universal stress protein [Deltaproteobacteria bacterium]|nr:MAG: universal stress protein [Deltaproteobacteria bacterium]